MLASHTFYLHNPREMLNVFSTTLLGLDEEGGADTLSGPVAGGTGRTSSVEDAGPRALRGAKEGGLQEGQEDPESPPSL